MPPNRCDRCGCATYNFSLCDGCKQSDREADLEWNGTREDNLDETDKEDR